MGITITITDLRLTTILAPIAMPVEILITTLYNTLNTLPTTQITICQDGDRLVAWIVIRGIILIQENLMKAVIQSLDKSYLRGIRMPPSLRLQQRFEDPV